MYTVNQKPDVLHFQITPRKSEPVLAILGKKQSLNLHYITFTQ